MLKVETGWPAAVILGDVGNRNPRQEAGLWQRLLILLSVDFKSPGCIPLLKTSTEDAVLHLHCLVFRGKAGFLGPGKGHGNHSPWGRKESDMTEAT